MMKKLLLTILLIFAGLAQADNEMSYTPNKLGGNMFFTYTQCVYVRTQEILPGNYYVYSTDQYGNKLVDGCYEYKYPFYFVTWNKGGKITVNVNSVTSLIK